MRIIVEHTLSDGCSYSCTDTFPIEHDSVEAAFVEFDDAMKAARGIFVVFGREFTTYDVVRCGAPLFYTVDEWFEANRPVRK